MTVRRVKKKPRWIQKKKKKEPKRVSHRKETHRIYLYDKCPSFRFHIDICVRSYRNADKTLEQLKNSVKERIYFINHGGKYPWISLSNRIVLYSIDKHYGKGVELLIS